jgi:hypothetical protein
MAEADDSGDHIAKEKAKYRYKKELRLRRVKDKKTGKITSIKKLVNVGYAIKQPEPYKTSYGSVITGEHKPEYKKRKTSRKKNYANIYKRKKYK